MANVILSNRQYDNRIRRMVELETLIKGLKDELDECKEAVTKSMDAAGVEEVVTDKFVIRNKTIIRNTFDSKAFQKDYKELYEDYLKVSSQVRFTHSEI